METKEVVAMVVAGAVGVGVASVEFDKAYKKFDEDCDEGNGKITKALHLIGGFSMGMAKTFAMEALTLVTILSIGSDKKK